MFSQLCLYTSVSLVFCYVLKWVVWMGLLLIAAGICFGFILLANQEMLYGQAYQKRWHLRVVDIPAWPYSALYSCHWLVSFNRLIFTWKKCFRMFWSLNAAILGLPHISHMTQSLRRETKMEAREKWFSVLLIFVKHGSPMNPIKKG